MSSSQDDSTYYYGYYYYNDDGSNHDAGINLLQFLSVVLLITIAILIFCLVKWSCCQNKENGAEDIAPVSGADADAGDDTNTNSIIHLNRGFCPHTNFPECKLQKLPTFLSRVSPSSIVLSTASNSLPFPKDGIKVSFLKEFIDSIGRANLGGKSTTDVCNDYVKAATQMSQLSYCELLTSQGNPAVGKARVFISHAWKYMFLDVVSALENHFSDAMDTVIWFDLFSNNQHKATELHFDWWCGTFKSAIQEFGHTVMILAPWNDPIPLTRGWCIFELYCTNVTNSRFDVAMPKDAREDFLRDMEEDVMKSIDIMHSKIDARNSTCFKPEDLARIHEAVEQTVGFVEVNVMVFRTLRDWIVSTISAERELLQQRFTNTRDKADELVLLKYTNILAQLYTFEKRKLLQSLPLFVTCYERRKTILGNNHPDTLTSMRNLSVNVLDAINTNRDNYNDSRKWTYTDFIDQFKYDGVISYYFSVPRLYDEHHNSIHTTYHDAHTLHIISIQERGRNQCNVCRVNFATYRCLRQGREAEPCCNFYICIMCLEENRKNDTKLDFSHLEISAIMMCKDCCDRQSRVLGMDHLETMETMQSLAILYTKRKSSITDVESRQNQTDWNKERKRLLEYCFRQRSLLLGHDNYHTIVSQYWLVKFYRSINPFGKGFCYGTLWYREIEAHFLEVLIKTKKTVGANHYLALLATLELYNFYDEMLRSQDALNLCHDNLLEKGQVLVILDRPNTPNIKDIVWWAKYQLGENEIYFENTRGLLNGQECIKDGWSYHYNLLLYFVLDILSIARLFYGLHTLIIYLAYNFIVRVIEIDSLNRPIHFSSEDYNKYWASIIFMLLDLNGIFLISILYFPDYLRLLVLRWLPCYSPVYFYKSQLFFCSIAIFLIGPLAAILVYMIGTPSHFDD